MAIDKLKKIIISAVGDKKFEDSENFIEDELLDSFDLIELVAAIEEEYGIEIDGEDLTSENFESFDTILALIDSYTEQ